MLLVFVLILVVRLLDARSVLLECFINELEDWSRLNKVLMDVPQADVWNELIHVPMTASVLVPEEAMSQFEGLSDSLHCQMVFQPLVLTPIDASDDFVLEEELNESDSVAEMFNEDLLMRVSKEYFSYQNLLSLFDLLEHQSTHRIVKSKVKVNTIAKSNHNLPVKVLTITDGTSFDKKKDVWVSCGQHAREWIAISACANLAVWLATSSDEKFKFILEKVNVHVVPLMNPDGYIMSHKRDRMWRKNVPKKLRSMRDGVDLNRNWPAHWGQETNFFDQQRNKQRESITFRGPAAASEPEVAGTIQYMTGLANLNLICAFDVHSYGQYVLRPPGYINEPNAFEFANKKLGDVIAQFMSQTHQVQYKSQLSAGLYPTFGGMDDWLHETFNCPAFTVELRDNGRYGFQLPADQIEATSEELLSAVYAAVSTLSV